MHKFFFCLFLMYYFSACYLKAETKTKPALHIKKATEKIEVDGVLNEPDWQTAFVAKDFFQNFPADTSYAQTKTEVRVTFDEMYLYISAVCYDDMQEKQYVIQSLKRDFSYPVSDAFAVYIDPLYDRTNGFCFGVNPFGVQREGLIQNGGDFGVTTSWDNKWYSEVKQDSGKWVVEIAIPFKSIRFRPDIKQWGINFSRNDLKRNENSSWAAVPRNFNVASLAYTGELIWDDLPQKTGSNISLIPYLIGGVNKDYSAKTPAEVFPNTGGDAKVAVTSSLNLDLTVNPDFSQVDVDRQVTNLTRFSLFFPERRQFFIENSDLFERFGFRQIRPFFSRRIGLHNGNIVPIIAGARLSGKIDQNWRIGVMNMQTAADTSLSLASQNYSVAAFQRQVFGRSNIAGIFVNRQGFDEKSPSLSDFNRVAGLDFNLASNNNRWQGKAFYHHSFINKPQTDNYTHATWLMYNSQTIFAMWNHEYVGKNYQADVGFVPRINVFDQSTYSIVKMAYWRFEPMFGYSFYPQSETINKVTPGIYSDIYFNSDFLLSEKLVRIYTDVGFKSSAFFNVEYNSQFTRLFYPIDVTGKGNIPFPAGEYNYQNAGLLYTSNQRKLFYYTAYVNYGTFYVGNKLSYSADISYRKQPWGIFSMRFTQDEIRLPEPYTSRYLTLIGPQVELSFTKNLFFTTFFQYNTQIDNLNINSRLQWRFKPMSDLFIVYTDNYDSNLGVKNRGIVLKLVYWFTV